MNDNITKMDPTPPKFPGTTQCATTGRTSDQCVRHISDGEKLFKLLNPEEGDPAWSDAQNIRKDMYEHAATQLISPHRQRADNWEMTRKDYLTNCEHRDKQMHEIAQYLGVDVFICDDGGYSQDPLYAKLPALVKEMAFERSRMSFAFVHLAKFVDTGMRDQVTPEQLVAAAIRKFNQFEEQFNSVTNQFGQSREKASDELLRRGKTISKLAADVTREQEQNRALQKQIQELTDQLNGEPPPGHIFCELCDHRSYTMEQADEHRREAHSGVDAGNSPDPLAYPKNFPFQPHP